MELKLNDARMKQKISLINKALMFAAFYANHDSNIPTIQLLLDAKCDITLRNRKKETALMIAVKQANTTSNFMAVKILNDAWMQLRKMSN